MYLCINRFIASAEDGGKELPRLLASSAERHSSSPSLHYRAVRFSGVRGTCVRVSFDVVTTVAEVPSVKARIEDRDHDLAIGQSSRSKLCAASSLVKSPIFGSRSRYIVMRNQMLYRNQFSARMHVSRVARDEVSAQVSTCPPRYERCFSFLQLIILSSPPFPSASNEDCYFTRQNK